VRTSTLAARPRLLRFVLSLVLALLPAGSVFAADRQSAAIQYAISLARPAEHMLHVTMVLPPGAGERDLQLPVWNALYQVRDFAQFVNWVRAKNANSNPLPITETNKSRWRISGAVNGATIEYEIAADDAGPYGAQLNSHHAFLNLAEVLMYAVDARSAPMRVQFVDLPAGWRVATALTPASSTDFSAENYDRLVDSPVELGAFEENDFDESGGHYRVVVDADPADYNLPKIVADLHRIVRAETTWMNDRPFSTYLFLYHFPRGPGGGGMEHAYCTAIDVSARVIADDPLALPSVTAHEFFHLWNVKRIRPQSLEPVDYTQENYTRALWFSEGVTSTVEDYALLQAGLLDASAYFERLGRAISVLQQRPARLTQSAEEASLDAWLEKYATYWRPQRSISYYNKGDLLGVLLDLQIREASRGMASLRDLFQWMNRNYAQKGAFFPDSEGVERAAETVSHADFSAFFQKYVAGTEEIPWNDFFHTVGLQLATVSTSVAEPGFTAEPEFGGVTVVNSVGTDSDAARAGLREGDTIIEVNGRVPSANLDQQLAALHEGDTLYVRVRNAEGERQLQWKLGSREQVRFILQDLPSISPAQKARRAAWLSGEDERTDQSGNDSPENHSPEQARP